MDYKKGTEVLITGRKKKIHFTGHLVTKYMKQVKTDKIYPLIVLDNKVESVFTSRVYKSHSHPNPSCFTETPR